MKQVAYIAGPMRGFPKFNFDQFDAAALRLRDLGYDVISPAQMDRDVGFDPEFKGELSKDFLDAAMRRDIEAIIERADCMVMLPGWENSTGANAELWLARWKHIPVLIYPSLELLTKAGEEDVLQEALCITQGDRQSQYGPPDQDFQRTARIWSALKGVEFCSRDVALFMIALKLSRETHQKKRDNAVDIAGYARCLWICQESEKTTNPKP